MPEAPNQPATDTPSDDKRAREQSTISFPYGDQNDAVAVATAIMSLGGGAVDVDQLAGAMKQEPNSGSFRLKVATARTFGVIITVGGKYQLTEIGYAIADAKREKAARVESFLKVPLYKRVYDEFRGKQLPPRPVALEHAFVGFGVSAKQKEKARHAFDRSAQQAGFFSHGDRDRLIRPANVGTLGGDAAPPSDGGKVDPQGDDHEVHPKHKPRREHDGGDGGGIYHPFIDGLLKTLPATGTVWTIEGRAAWLEAAASVFKLLYQGDGKITVTAKSDATN